MNSVSEPTQSYPPITEQDGELKMSWYSTTVHRNQAQTCKWWGTCCLYLQGARNKKKGKLFLVREKWSVRERKREKRGERISLTGRSMKEEK